MPLRTILLLTALSLFSVAACGSAPVPPPSTLQATAPARDLAVFTRLTTINPSTPGASESLAAVDAAMVEAGYKVAKSEDNAEVIAVINVSAVVQRSMVSVTVNGQRQVNHLISVEVQLRGKADNTVLDAASATFESGEEEGARRVARTIVGRLVSADKVSLYAQQLKRQQDTLRWTPLSRQS